MQRVHLGGTQGMTLEDLRAFVAAYQAKSLSAAARNLGCTQAAVAQHVRRLERELEVGLFERVRRGIAPTEQGRILYEGASSALASLDTAVQAATDAAVRIEGRLRLAGSASATSGPFLRPAILALQESQPDAIIQIELENTGEGRLDAVREGRADLALVPIADPFRGLESRTCLTLPLGLVVHKEHPLARRRQLQLRELSGIRYIAQSESSGTYRHVEAALARHGVALKPSQIVEDPRAARLMVELGRGETFMPIALAPSLKGSGPVKLIPIPALAPIQMAWVARSFALLPQVSRCFMQLVADLTEKQFG